MEQKRNWFTEEIKDEKVKNYLSVFLEYLDDRLKWYKKYRKRKGVISNILLIIAVLAFTLSLSLIIIYGPNDSQGDSNSYAIGYICLLIASTMLLFDRLFGHSSGWVRYMMAQLEIEKVIGEYHGQWINSISKMDLENLTTENKTILINLLMNFDKTIKGIVIKETLEWKSNFTAQLEKFRSDVDKNLQKAKTDLEKHQSELLTKSKKGNFTLLLKNPKVGEIEIVIKSRELVKPITKKIDVSQSSVNFMELEDGTYSITCKVLVDDKEKLVKETILSIQPGKTLEKSLDLTK